MAEENPGTFTYNLHTIYILFTFSLAFIIIIPQYLCLESTLLAFPLF